MTVFAETKVVKIVSLALLTVDIALKQMKRCVLTVETDSTKKIFIRTSKFVQNVWNHARLAKLRRNA